MSEISEKGKTSEKVLNDSPAQEYHKQVCVDCREFTENYGLCVAGPGDILLCLQIREKILQQSLLQGTEDMFSKFFSADPKCACNGSGLVEKLDKNKGGSE